MDKKFRQLSQAEGEKKFPESDYLMTLNLTPEELAQRFDLAFLEASNGVNPVWFSWIAIDGSSYVYQFRYENTDSARRTMVTVRGRDIDLRQAYASFSQAIKLSGSDIFWLSDSL